MTNLKIYDKLTFAFKVQKLCNLILQKKISVKSLLPNSDTGPMPWSFRGHYNRISEADFL